MVTIEHGADSEQAELAGRTIQEAREAYRHVFHIPGDAIAKVNGKEVPDTYQLQNDDRLVFEKSADKFAAA